MRRLKINFGNLGTVCHHNMIAFSPDPHNIVLSLKAKRQYLLTLKVSRYCLLALNSRVDSVSINGVMDVTKYNITAILYFKSNSMCTGNKCASICITRGALPSKHETFRRCCFNVGPPLGMRCGHSINPFTAKQITVIGNEMSV